MTARSPNCIQTAAHFTSARPLPIGPPWRYAHRKHGAGRGTRRGRGEVGVEALVDIIEERIRIVLVDLVIAIIVIADGIHLAGVEDRGNPCRGGCETALRPLNRKWMLGCRRRT